MSRYLVLSETIPGEEIPKLMGRVVLSTVDPLKDYVPDESEGYTPQDIVPNMCLPVTVYKSRSDVVKLTTSRSLSARLTQYFSAQASQMKDSEVQISSKEVKRYRIANHAVKYGLLMNDARFKSAVEGLFQQHKAKEAYWIVGYLTTRASRWSVQKDQETSVGAKMRVPIGEAAGVSSSVDPEVEAALKKAAQAGTTAIIEAEEVFAVAYEVLGREGWRKAGIVLNGEKRVQGTHLSLADGDGASDEEIDDEAEVNAAQSDDVDILLYE